MGNFIVVLSYIGWPVWSVLRGDNLLIECGKELIAHHKVKVDYLKSLLKTVEIWKSEVIETWTYFFLRYPVPLLNFSGNETFPTNPAVILLARNNQKEGDPKVIDGQE